MIFPGLENAFFIFKVFHDFPGRWEPCLVPRLGQGSTWMMSGTTLKIKLIGQRSRSQDKKSFSQHSTGANLGQCLSMQIEPSVHHGFR